VCDTVAEWVRIGRPLRRLLVDAEAQARPHPDMLERLGEYAYRLRRELRHARNRNKYDVLSILLNMTGPAQAGELDMTVTEANDAGARLKIVLRAPREMDAAELLARVANDELERPLLPWVALMHGAEKPNIINEWKRVAEQERDDRWRSDLGALALIFADFADRKPIWKAELEGWNVRESTVIREWQLEAKVENTQEKLLELLQGKFGASLPTDVRDGIERCKKLDTLNQWFRAAITAPSLPAYQEAAANDKREAKTRK